MIWEKEVIYPAPTPISRMIEACVRAELAFAVRKRPGAVQ
jgi:hypothetical protein